ncbi:MAG: glycosyltransferase family 2 protein [Deltaproteobacteria bacterium]|jgi:glycosyltransferase involved in cell wall biosynthesis|nr:glycosyltransferase family 2 protein [Deltaproteobacteria bacterium]MBW2532023.1 glycosyltransferase family 2 protein [Deltaproteobacteria bacterium]
MPPTEQTSDSTALVDRWRERVARLLIDRRIHRAVDQPRLTLVVIAYRSDPTDLRLCLESIDRACRKAGGAIERMVADCGGNERCHHIITELCDTELVLLPDCTLNEARNAVIAWSEGELVMLIDDDGILEDDAVAAMLRHFEASDVVGVRGRIRYKRQRYLTALATHYNRGDEVVDEILDVEGHMALRRDHTLRAGGFDESLFGGEGLLITYRLLHHHPGMRALYAPDVIMRHDFFHDWKHFVRKSAVFTNQRGALVDHFGQEPGFEEFVEAHFLRKRKRAPLTVDERLACRGLKIIRSVIQLATRIRRRGRPEAAAYASPRRG